MHMQGDVALCFRMQMAPLFSIAIFLTMKIMSHNPHTFSTNDENFVTIGPVLAEIFD